MSNTQNELESGEKQNIHEEAKDENNQSYKEYIRNKIKEKAIQIKKDLASMEEKALVFLKKVFQVVQKNQNIQTYLKSLKNYYLNYFFNYFGYRYESNIENPNFFHFVSQAWIVNAFEGIKSNCNLEQENYSSILEKIFDVEVDRNQLKSSLELITETIYVSDPAIKLTELTLSKNFLKHISSVLKTKRKEFDSSKPITRGEFNVIVFEILKKTVNLTINEVDCVETAEDDLTLYNTFNELTVQQDRFTLEEFTRKVEERREGNNSNQNDITINNTCEAFYYFAQSNLQVLLIDLELFNQQYTSFLEKLRIIITKKRHNFKDGILKLSANVSGFYENVRSNLKFKNLIQFYKGAGEKLAAFNENTCLAVSSNYNSLKSWATRSNYKDLFYLPSAIFQRVSKYSSTSTVFLYERIYQPSRDITVNVTAHSYKFVVHNLENARETSISALNAFKENSARIWKNIKEEYVDKNIRMFVDEERNIIVIEINRKVFSDINIQKRFAAYVYEQLKNIKIRESLSRAYEATKETSLEVKHYLLEKYRRFLSSAPCETREKKNE